MKQILFSFLFVLLSGNCLFGQFSMDRYHPKELIISKHIDTCNIYSINLDGSLSLEQSITYDVLGNELKNIQNQNGYEYVYVYNEKGLKVKESFIPFGEDPYETDTLIYDENENLIERITFSNNAISRRNTYQYKNGLLYLDTYILKGNVHVETSYTYNESKNIDTVYRIFKGRKDGYYKYTYDQNQYLIGFNSYHSNGGKWLTHEYTVNEKGLRTEFRVINESGSLIQLYRTEYDAEGLILSTERYTSILNSDVSTGDYSKELYNYSSY